MTDNYLWNLIVSIVLIAKDNQIIVLLLSFSLLGISGSLPWLTLERLVRHLFPAKKSLDKSKTII